MLNTIYTYRETGSSAVTKIKKKEKTMYKYHHTIIRHNVNCLIRKQMSTTGIHIDIQRRIVHASRRIFINNLPQAFIASPVSKSWYSHWFNLLQGKRIKLFMASTPHFRCISPSHTLGSEYQNVEEAYIKGPSGLSRFKRHNLTLKVKFRIFYKFKLPLYIGNQFIVTIKIIQYISTSNLYILNFRVKK